MKRLLLILTLCVAGCATSAPDGSPLSANQQAINATMVSYQALDAAILAADAAVKSKTLKGQAARDTADAMAKAKLALDLALAALQSANGVKP